MMTIFRIAMQFSSLTEDVFATLLTGGKENGIPSACSLSGINSYYS